MILALHERQKSAARHVPYRNSMLTSVLRDSLGGNCKTVMIATVHPAATHTDESISTCKFAQRVAQVKNEVSLAPSLAPIKKAILRTRGALLGRTPLCCPCSKRCGAA